MVALRRQPDDTAAVARPKDLVLAEVADDTEEAPWMVLGDPQFRSAPAFAQSLRYYARQTAQPWYVAGMVPLRFARPQRRGKGQVAPDTMVAFGADHSRTSYDLEAEGRPPAFVLEVISSSSAVRDLGDKRALYELLEVPPQGEVLRTLEQAEDARQQAEDARQQAEERERVTAAENARLREELERLRHP
ncbi:MAG: hypothetical protein NVSMB65_17460 [Chloroflexota bacterium]